MVIIYIYDIIWNYIFLLLLFYFSKYHCGGCARERACVRACVCERELVIKWGIIEKQQGWESMDSSQIASSNTWQLCDHELDN